MVQEPKSTQQNKSLSGNPLASCREKGSDGEGFSLYKERDGDIATAAKHRDCDDGMQIYVLGGVAAATQVGLQEVVFYFVHSM